MNTEHYKAASERTDADERALVPAIRHANTGKPAGIRETQNEQDNREFAPNKPEAGNWPDKPAPNKAQHSPLPKYWKEGLHGFTDAERQTIIRAVNHADKLAEALKQANYFTRRAGATNTADAFDELLATYEAAQ